MNVDTHIDGFVKAKSLFLTLVLLVSALCPALACQLRSMSLLHKRTLSMFSFLIALCVI